MFLMVRLLKPKVRIARRWFKKVLLAGFVLGVIAGGFYLVFKSDFLTVKHINCAVKDKTSLADEKRWCQAIEREVRGQRIFFLKQQAIASKIREKFLPVGEVAFQRKYPQTVSVQIVERKPIAKVCRPGGLEFLVDKEGVIYAEVPPESKDLKKVILELDFEPALGQTISPDIVSLILLEEPQISMIKFNGQEGIEAGASGELKIFFSRKKDLLNQIHSLQMILKKYKIEGKSLKSVDLRYKQPVVRY